MGTASDKGASDLLREGRDSYWSNQRPDLLELATRFTRQCQRQRALDVGCANGVFAHSLFSLGFSEVWGVEPDPDCAAQAATRLTGVSQTRFPPADISDNGPFDLIVFGDSLEHLEDPWSGLAAARSLLSAEGVLILSVPNVAHYKVLLPALRGRWQYGAAGLLDRTHLHFFTPQSIATSVRESGLMPAFARRVCPLPHGAMKRTIVRATGLVAPHLVTSKVYLVCRRVETSALVARWPRERTYFGR
jgi:2-polyprenyl-3-methyl-5-hydroxy-6-metoxy-1,4-benzoquinol methylase